jgi:predicted  nucleic acid-binding Zn-ribbon protein
MARDIDNSQDIMDSRDIIERLEELQSERDDKAAEIKRLKAEGADKEDLESLRDELNDLDEELEPLKAFCEECSGYAPDWEHGATVIRDSYFQEYAEQLADDCGMVDSKIADKWPYRCIDWEKAAEELQQDYTCVDFDGVDYWVQ